jgi:hypothetical protein
VRHTSTVAAVLQRAHLAGLVHSLGLGILAHAAIRKRPLVMGAHWHLVQLEVQGLAEAAARGLDAAAWADAPWRDLTVGAPGVALNWLLHLVLGVDVGVHALAGPSHVPDALVAAPRML